MCTHSFTTEYDPAPSVLPVLYRHGCICGCGGRPLEAAIEVCVKVSLAKANSRLYGLVEALGLGGRLAAWLLRGRESGRGRSTALRVERREDKGGSPTLERSCQRFEYAPADGE